MEVLIKNYKTNDTSKKRNEKRERELGVLTLFKQYGIKLIKLEKQERENNKKMKQKKKGHLHMLLPVIKPLTKCL